ncbi:MAG TPA: sodium:calcium antiporter [Acidobacteriota bacterium]|nr:sodium:calcium antiporter [Acidobacteriota bacterium]
MEQYVAALAADAPWWGLGLIIAGSLAVLWRGADVVVSKAVILSELSGIPKVVVGATVVSLGTTTPETAVSVLAALGGRPGLALGNAVGSIICDTGLILGLACLLRPLPLHRRIVNRQGWIQFGAGVSLVLGCLPFGNLSLIFEQGGSLPQVVGVAFLVALVGYAAVSIRWAHEGDLPVPELIGEKDTSTEQARLLWVLLKLFLGLAVVILACEVLIPTTVEAARRLEVPEGVIAATLVAFGTSLPELVTAVTSSFRGHGEIAVGNVVGADILNVLWVAGLSAAVTRGGLQVSPEFFSLYFPSMLFLLLVFRIGIVYSGRYLSRLFGGILLTAYLIVTVAGYLFE